MNKRGITTVVTTLVFILLAIVSIAVVWMVVANLIDEGEDSVQVVESINLDLRIKNASVDPTDISVVVQRNTGKGNLTGVKFLFYDGEKYNESLVRVPLSELEQKNFDFDFVGVRTLESISVAPVFVNSLGNEIVGNPTDSWKFSKKVYSSGGDGGNPVIVDNDGEEVDLCGNGEINEGETCDVGGSDDPGCVDCVLTPNYYCSPPPNSVCQLNDMEQPSCPGGDCDNSCPICPVGSFCADGWCISPIDGEGENCPGGSCDQPQCTDSDIDDNYPDGDNPYLKGTVIVNGISTEDYCNESGTELYEQLCAEGEAISVISRIYDCVCNDGVCEFDGCGDGNQDEGEECDDGIYPPESGDGCDDQCQHETGGWACSTNYPTQCFYFPPE